MSYFPLQYKLELMGPDDVCSQLSFLSGILSVVTRREGRSEGTGGSSPCFQGNGQLS